MTKFVIKVLALLTAISSIGITVFAENNEVADNSNLIHVIGGNGPVLVTVCDDEHYNNGSYEQLIFSEDSEPFIDENGRTQLPIRAIGEELGFSVDWDSVLKKITLTKNDQTIVFHMGSNEFTKNGETIKMDTTPMLVNDRTFVPLRFLCEAVGYTVEYTDRTKVIEANSATTDIEDMWNFEKHEDTTIN